MAMPTDGTDLLRLTQWLSPAFPISAYAYSHGLEQAMSAGQVHDAASLEAWIQGILTLGAGRNDAILLCLALRRARPDAELADLAEALAGSAERWAETRDQGAAFAETLAAMGEDAPPPLPYPLAVGVAARALDLAPELVAAQYLQGFAGSLVSAGVRFIPLGQSVGQTVLAALRPAVAALAAEAAQADLDDLGGGAFAGDLAALAHETQEVRLFRS